MSIEAEKSSSDDNTMRTASRLRIGVIVVFGLILLLYLAGRMGLQIGQAGVVFRSHTGASQSSAFLGDGVMLLLAIAIYWLAAALNSIAQGGLFTREVVRQFRQFALWLLVMALYSFISPFLIAQATLKPGPPHRVMISLDIRDLLLIGITALLFLITRLLERAGEIEQENQEII